MFGIKTKKKQVRQTAAKKSTTEVGRIKTTIHRKATESKKDIDRLNRLLRSNGITLRIHIATGGKH